MELVASRPICDTLALFMLLNSFIFLIFRSVLYEPGPWTHVVIAFPVFTTLSKLISQPEQHGAEARSTKRSSKVRPPLVWAAVTRVWLFLRGEVPLIGKANNRDQNNRTQENIPQVRFVSETKVGFIFPEPSLTRFVVNDLEWTQVYRNDEMHLVILYGLCPGTIYEALAIHSTHSQTIEFSFCTALHSTSDQKPRKLATPIRDIALDSAREILSNERSQVRKFRRESLKRLAAVRHDIEAMDHKVVTKRKADERAMKRVMSLQERIDQLASEIAAFEGEKETGLGEVTELANEAQRIMLERQSKQQDLDVSVRVWAELQSSKQDDVQKLFQRCEKLQERVKYLEHELAQQASIRKCDIEAYISYLREQRKTRKDRRARLESDFVQAINKLGSS